MSRLNLKDTKKLITEIKRELKVQPNRVRETLGSAAAFYDESDFTVSAKTFYADQLMTLIEKYSSTLRARDDPSDSSESDEKPKAKKATKKPKAKAKAKAKAVKKALTPESSSTEESSSEESSEETAVQAPEEVDSSSEESEGDED